MEHRLNVNRTSTEFQSMLTSLARNLTNDELESMKFWCRNQKIAGRAVMEEINEPEKLWDVLQKRGKLNHHDTEFLKQLLRQSIQRVDLIGVINSYESNLGLSTVDGETDLSTVSSPGVDAPKSYLQPLILTRDRDTGGGYAEGLCRELDLISEQYGSGWRSFARKLELSEAELDGIAAKYSTDLREQIRQAMKIWCGKKREHATRKGLVEALRNCQRNKLATRVEKL